MDLSPKGRAQDLRNAIRFITAQTNLPILLIQVGIMMLVVPSAADFVGLGDPLEIGLSEMVLGVAGILILVSGIALDWTVGQRTVRKRLARLSLHNLRPDRAILAVVLLGVLFVIMSQVMTTNQVSRLGVFAFFSLLIHYAFAHVFGTATRDGVQTEELSGTQQGFSFARSVAAIGSLAIVVYLIGNPAVYSHLGLDVQEMIYNLRVARMNERDLATIEKGYYENLIRVDWLTSEAMYEQLRMTYYWVELEDTQIGRLTGDFYKWELIPQSEDLLYGVPMRINRWGMRDRDYEREKPPSTYRIAVLGQSVAMGLGVHADKTFESILEERLNRENENGPYTKYEILDFGVPDYTALHQAILLEDKVLSFEPDMVLYVAYIDKGYAVWHLAEMVSSGVDIPSDSLRQLVKEAGVDDDMDVHEAERRLKTKGDEILLWAYSQIVQQSREHDILPVWAFVPVVDEGRRNDEIPEHIRLAEEAGFIVLNLSDVYDGYDPRGLKVEGYDLHPNEAGHRLIAERLYEELEARNEILSLGLSDKGNTGTETSN